MLTILISIIIHIINQDLQDKAHKEDVIKTSSTIPYIIFNIENVRFFL